MRYPGLRARRIGIAVALVVVLVVGGGVLWFRGGDVEPPVVADCHPPVVPSLPAPSSADELRVVEQGFSRTGTRGSRVSLGAVVENRGVQIAYRTRISFKVLDADQRWAVSPKGRTLLVQEIPVILPGQRIATGAAAYLAVAPSGLNVVPANMSVELGSTHVLPANSLSTVGTRYVRMRPSSVEVGSPSVSYIVDSQYCAPVVSRGTALVFRDRAGAVIGGSFVSAAPRERCHPGGKEETTVVMDSYPSDADPGRTEVWEYCDVAAAASPRTSDGPVN